MRVRLGQCKFIAVHRRSTFALPALLAAGSVLAALADDWPQWRGPNRDGAWRETGILETFPREGLKVRWRQAVGWG